MVLKEIYDLNIYFRTMRWSYMASFLRKLIKYFFGLLISGIITKQIETIESTLNTYFNIN